MSLTHKPKSGSLLTGTEYEAADAHTGNLTQARSHDSPDTDSATSALHHTLGAGANQAAAGNHAHWTQNVNQSGASIAAWTVVSGTWASDGAIIQQTQVSDTAKLLRYDTAVPLGHWLMQAEIRFPGTATSYAGFVVLNAANGTLNSVHPRFLFANGATSKVQLQREGTVPVKEFTVTLNQNIWYTLRALMVDGVITVWLDGALLGSAWVEAALGDLHRLALFGFGSTSDWRNISTWTPTLP